MKNVRIILFILSLTGTFSCQDALHMDAEPMPAQSLQDNIVSDQNTAILPWGKVLLTSYINRIGFSGFTSIPSSSFYVERVTDGEFDRIHYFFNTTRPDRTYHPYSNLDQTHFQYDANNRLERVIWIRFADDLGSPITFFEYDQKGNAVKEIKVIKDILGIDTLKTVEIINQFDSHNRLVRQDFFPSDTTITLQYKKYFYNADGNLYLIRSKYKNGWEKTRFEFSNYDSYKNPLTKNRIWQLIFRNYSNNNPRTCRTHYTQEFITNKTVSYIYDPLFSMPVDITTDDDKEKTIGNGVECKVSGKLHGVVLPQ